MIQFLLYVVGFFVALIVIFVVVRVGAEAWHLTHARWERKTNHRNTNDPE